MLPVTSRLRDRRLAVVAGSVTALFVALGVVATASLLLGIPRLSPAALGDVLTGGGDRLERLAVTQLRLPRLLLAASGGASLALAGAMMQDAMRNPLAGPELLGVSSGGAAVVATITVLELPVPFVLYPWLTLAGGLAAAGVVLAALSRSRRRASPALLVLIGAAMSAILGAIVTAIVSLGAPLDAHLIFRFLAGSLAGHTWDDVTVVLPWEAAGMVAALAFARPLNLLQLGDDMAEAMGLPVVTARFGVMLTSAALVAAVVAASGAIGFVALPAPHLARRLLRTTDARRVLPVAGLIGAVLLASADLVARELLSPREIPVGMWTTVIGGPVLLLMLRRHVGRR